MGVEFELKYRADAGLLSRLRQELPGQEACYRMETTYFDTPTELLSQRRWTLRCRKENQSFVCTLKTPAQGFARREWEVSCRRIEDAIEMLCKLGAPEELPVLVGDGLIPICGARFTRIAKEITLGQCVVELALDEGVLTGGGKQIPLCEVELELKQGDMAACVAYAKALERMYGLVPEEKSKFRRALALYKGE